MGKLNKQILSQFAEFDCERQLFIELGKKDDRWFPESRKIVSLEGVNQRYPSKFTFQIGKDYEQEIYATLKARLNSEEMRIESSTTPQGTISQSFITPDLFKTFRDRLKDGTSNKKLKSIMLLEPQLSLPESFLRYLFEIQDDQEIPIKDLPKFIRPDIMVLTKPETKNEIKFLEEPGNVSILSDKDRQNKIGINIYDIKASPMESVGKKHLIELTFYAEALYFFLKQENLDDQYYIEVESNGILPKINNFSPRNIGEFQSSIVPIRWQETHRAYSSIKKQIRELKNKCPQPLENSQVHIQPACGRCNYLSDCKITLGYTGPNGDPTDWDIRLLPYTTRPIIKQLEEYGFYNIKQVANNIHGLRVGSTPQAIYSQLPLIKLKSQGLVSKDPVYPIEGELHSVAIPKWNEMSLVINAEEDPIFKRIMSIGLHLNISIGKNAVFRDIYNEFWKIWKTGIEDENTSKEIYRDIVNIAPSATISETKKLKKLLESLLESNDDEINYFKIIMPGEELGKDFKAVNTVISLSYSEINEGLENYEEYALVKKVVEKVYQILYLTNFIESYIKADEQYEDKIITRAPILAVFYWSREILEGFQDMLERHILSLITEESIRKEFGYIVQWITPTESNLVNPQQHKKIYDLRIFAETTIGIHAIINYTWHKIAKLNLNVKSYTKYWREHFNYIDFQVWHEIIAEKSFRKKFELIENLKKEMKHKTTTLERLRQLFLREGRNLISKQSRPVYDKISRATSLSTSYHYFSHIWFLYSKLTASIDEHEALYYRTMYPEFTIGKLKGARVRNLKEFKGRTEKQTYYTFTLESLSSNMKIDEGSMVLLIPSELRDMGIRARWWTIKIERMVWDSKNGLYEVKTVSSTNRVFEKLKKEVKLTNSKQWYLYPNSIDAWTAKLVGKNGLLHQLNLGQSWLGEKLSFEWNLLHDPRLSYPNTMKFNLAEIYLFAPILLGPLKTSSGIQELLTDVYPTPDISQENAIKNSLNSVISLIHGPPGTGKSQTIIALIDEFSKRNQDKPIKILITAFSYPAMKVIVEKLRQSVDKDNKPTSAAKISKLFLRSEFQNPINNENYKESDDKFVHDLMRKGSGTWKLNIDLDPDSRKPIFKNKTIEDYFPNDLVLFANAHQLFRLQDRHRETKELICIDEDFSFDIIIVDEASQLPSDYILSSLVYMNQAKRNVNTEFSIPVIEDEKIETVEGSHSLRIKDNIKFNELTKLVIVGDHNQLPPVQSIKPPEKLKIALGSLFQFYKTGHKLKASQLERNYRSHQDIVSYTSKLGFYENLVAFEKNAKKTLTLENLDKFPKLIKEAMDPDKVVVTITHYTDYEIAVSKIEADIVVNLIMSFYQSYKPKDDSAEIKFWRNEVGVVAPHNAQGRLIIRDLYEKIINANISKLSPDGLMKALRNTIYSVEKFQGSDRTFIIASIGISSKDQLSAEEDFIYDINRFNVLTSRAKSKIILISSENFLDYFPKDIVNLENASKIRYFAEEFCGNSEKIVYKFGSSDKQIELRWY